ncbi:MAG: transglutaminase family protein [Myxococcota bacterium]|nr:transglutaminase family protein [Myxococcota bacterium]
MRSLARPQRTSELSTLILAAALFLAPPAAASSGQFAWVHSAVADYGSHGVGEIEHTFTSLGVSLNDIRGLAFQEDASGSFLYVLNRPAGDIHCYEVSPGGSELTWQYERSMTGVESARGLAYSREGGQDVLYFNDWKSDPPLPGSYGAAPPSHGVGPGRGALVSRLYRYEIDTGLLEFADLSVPAYEIEDRELHGVERVGAELYVSFDPSSYPGHRKKVRRGIARFPIATTGWLGSAAPPSPIQASGVADDRAQPFTGWAKLVAGTADVRHMPSANKAKTDDDGEIESVDPSHALAAMSVDGVDYLWGSVDSHSIYLADAETGRGIFAFDRPFETKRNLWPMAAGLDHLWVAERLGGAPDVIHRISILDDVTRPLAGPKRLRRYRMKLTSDREAPHLGYVQHTFGRPYPNTRAQNQGIFAGTHEMHDLSGGAVSQRVLSYDPAGDPDAKQKYTHFVYMTTGQPSDPDRFQSEIQIDGWSASYRRFVYPHLTELDSGPPGTHYLDDDETLYDVAGASGTWSDLIERVEEWIESEYGAPVRRDNAYWRARDVMDYVLESYHYPDDGDETPEEDRVPATVDYARGHFDANPGDEKAALSADSNWSDNVIACSGTTMLQNGAMRHLGIPARWVGTSSERGSGDWVADDGDEFLEAGEQAKATNGHRYAEVWMGEAYGWVRFDGTPERPATREGFDRRPKRKTQWTLMSEAGAGIEDKRVIHNIGAHAWSLMLVPFESIEDCEDGNRQCGSVRYNLRGTYTDPTAFEPSSQSIRYEPLLFVEDVSVERPRYRSYEIEWTLAGDWSLDPDATLDIELQIFDSDDGWTKVTSLAAGHPAESGSLEVEIDDLAAGTYRVRVTKTGDVPTGNASASFEILRLWP